MTYDNTNSGALFKNERKEGNQPDYTGPFTGENGEEMQVAGWLRKSKSGKPYIAVKVSPKFKPQAREMPTPGPGYSDGQPDDDPFDDSIPF